MLKDLVLLKACTRNEEGILKVDLILLIVVIVCEFNESVNRESALLVAVVCELAAPYLVGLALRNVVCSLRLDVRIISRNYCVSCTVAALALVLVKRLAYRLP